MPQPVDVGSTLGGRYKVTAQVLASAENDLVLDGVDLVLNRAVSILLAAPENTDQVSASAREVATGERDSNVQILDLGISDGRTYLVTSNANAVDLLDLVIERDAPYIEPFFTDTLGSEIFGMPRSREPEDDEDMYAEEPQERAPRKPRLSGRPLPKLSKFGRGGAAAGAPAGAALARAEEVSAERDLEFGDAADAPAEAATGAATVPPPSKRSLPGTPASDEDSAPATGPNPKVSRWTETDYSEDYPASGDADGVQASTKAAGRDGSRRAASFPAAAVTAGDGSGGDNTEDYNEDYNEDYDENGDEASARGNRTFSRVLVGAVLTLVLIAAVVLAVGTLGGIKNDPQADSNTTPSATAPVEAAPPETPAPEAEPAAPAPVTAGVSRLVPANPALDAENDGALPKILDGNDATYWSSYEYANDTFGGYAPNLALVVELEEDSAINKIDITQLNGTGGSFSVLLNDAPTLEGATIVAETGFTGPTTSIQVPKTDGETATAQYVIVNFTQLPRLSGMQAAYPYGLRIADIAVS
ncbi:ABC transporter substrate-binding protein [Arthrobacter sp. NPDC097144]|uniref:ABC transporter substrate-binding protein n=1 Tax=Arthrobacter sp. NPDC097144 TaxID=3363946 RepID=UPI0038098AF8